MIDNELLKQALDETADERFSKYDLQPEEKPHRFSLAFRIREKSITRLSKKPEKRKGNYMPLKRMTVMIAAISVLAALGIAAGATFLVIRGFNVTTQSSHHFGITHTDTVLEVDYSKYDIKSEIALDEFYCLSEDSGCEFVEHGLYDQGMNSIRYTHNGYYLSFGQYTADTGLFMEDISDVIFHEVEINGNDGVLCTETDSNDKSLTWIQDGYVFSIYAKEITEEEIMGFAETITTYEPNPSEFTQADEGFDFDFSKYDLKTSLDEQYWLPPESGFELADERIETYYIQLDYYYNGLPLFFAQNVNAIMSADTEFDNYEVTVANADIAYISRYDDGEDAMIILSWVFDGYEFEIEVDYNIGDEELINLAESITLRD